MCPDKDEATGPDAAGFCLRPPIDSDYRAIASWIADAKACAHWAGPKLRFPFAGAELAGLLAGGNATSHALIDADGRFVAFGQLVTKAPDLVRLARIIVAPDQRGVGIGRILCEHLIAEATRHPEVDTLSLGVYRDNRAAIALYLSLGFVETPPHARPDVIYMTRALPLAEAAVPPRLTFATTDDTGAHLRSLYAAQGGVGEIFSAKVADYVASRPDYPDALFETLRRACGLTDGSAVVDVGAGTGLLTRGLLDAGYGVTAVEPNAAMLAAADRLLGHHPRYRSIAGTAEAMELAPASAALITAAQAFHWFDIERARAEFLRVLNPTGQVALIWNDRRHGDPLHTALDELFAEFGGAKRGALLAHEERHDVPRFFGSGPSAEYSWPHPHLLNEDGLLSLVFSRSYMPERDSAAGRLAAARVREIFQRFAGDGRLPVHYTTVAIIGRPG
jgi:ribosomal protein S18 acetylase RimI-like enzyme/SAM-dependent methyltransferase